MNPRILPCFALCLAYGEALYSTPTEADLQRAIDEAIRAGGGDVSIPAGTFLIEKGLKIENAKNLRILGSPGDTSVLRLPAIAFAQTASASAVGTDRIIVSRQQGFRPGMRLRIETDGEIDRFTKQPKPYVLAFVKEVEEGAILLEKPLAFPVPAGTLIRHEDAPNLIEIRGSCDGVRIEGLVLDGGRVADDPPVRGHVQLCAVFAQGKYTYEAGPTGPKPKGIVVSGCLIRNCHGRGVALYSVEDSEVSHCRLFDMGDEAIDLDHFTVRTRVIGNEVRRGFIGVEMNDASDCVVADNRIHDCRTGIHLWQFCKLPGLNEGNRIEGNHLEGTLGAAIQIQEYLTKNVVERNTIMPQP